MEDEYENVSRGKLKLRITDSDISKKKKKKNKKNKKKEQERLERGVQQTNDEEQEARQATSSGSQMTKAEVAFKKQQEKMVSALVFDGCFGVSNDDLRLPR